MRESVDSFLNFMTVERGVSPNTLAAYKNDLYQLSATSNLVTKAITMGTTGGSWTVKR